MALTINTDLKPWNPVRCPVIYQVTSDEYVQTAGQAPLHRMVFNGSDMPVAGDSIDIYIDPNLDGGYAGTLLVTLTAVAGTPSGNGNEFLEYTSGSVDDWITDELIPRLKENYYLATYFDINNDTSNAVTFELTDLDQDPVMAYANGFTPTTSTSSMGATEVLAENFGLIFQLWVEDDYQSGDFVKVLQEVYPANSKGSATFKPHEVLRDELAPHMPSATMTTAVVMTKMARHFFIRTSEQYGDPVAQYPVTTSDTVLAHLAGRDEVDRLNYPDWQDQLYPSANAHQFLTTWPNTSQESAKRITEAQREFLATLEPALGFTYNSVKLKADLYFTDGTSSLANVLDTVTPSEEGRPLLFAVGVEARSLAAIQPSKVIDHYNVYITVGVPISPGVYQDQRYSERRWYRVDYRVHENYRQLHYFNSQGGVDTMALTGERSRKLQVQRMVSERHTEEIGTLDDARDVEVRLSTLDQPMEVGTVYLNRDEAHAIRELYASERVVERVNAQHWPVQVLDEKLDVDDEATDLKAFKVKFRHSFRNTALS